MKRMIYVLIMFVISLGACEQKMDIYEGTSGIYFDPMEAVLDTIVVPWGLKNSNVKKQNMNLRVCLMGDVVSYDRKFMIRVITDAHDTLQAVEGKDFRLLQKEYAILAGKADALVEIELLRADDLAERPRRFTLQLEETEELGFLYSRVQSLLDSIGETVERVIDYQRVIYMDERFKTPVWWSLYGGSFFGKFSTKKAIFICDQMGYEREDFVAPFTESNLNEAKLRFAARYLHEYLQEHPEIDEDGELMTMGPDAQK